MALKQLSDAGTDGTVLGQSSADKIGFYGATPVVRASAITAVATTATTADIAALGTALNSVITTLKNLGLTA